MILDFNCDLGEGEPPLLTEHLMQWVTSANIAAGGHAGDEESIRRCIRLATEANVRIGAHPGFADREGFGRREQPITTEELALLLQGQVGLVRGLAFAAGNDLHHVKLHGALYHQVERDASLASAFVAWMAAHAPGVSVYCLPSGLVAAAGRGTIPILAEGFLDRGYRRDGRLIGRGEPGALLNLEEVEARLLQIASGNFHSIPAGVETWCVHSDSPDALAILKLARKAFPK